MAVNMLLMMQEIYQGTSELSAEEVAKIDEAAPEVIPELIAMILAETRGIDPLANDETVQMSVALPLKTPKQPGRNDPCPCGLGRKYMTCCGRN
jgi:uncharacterized protein YecA (UPF0149 family)